MYEGADDLKGKLDKICYAFYRYEIKNGLSNLESLIGQITSFLSKEEISEGRLQDINELLRIISLAVERKDFLVAADLLKYELYKRLTNDYDPGLSE